MPSTGIYLNSYQTSCLVPATRAAGCNFALLSMVVRKYLAIVGWIETLGLVRGSVRAKWRTETALMELSKTISGMVRLKRNTITIEAWKAVPVFTRRHEGTKGSFVTHLAHFKFSDCEHTIGPRSELTLYDEAGIAMWGRRKLEQPSFSLVQHDTRQHQRQPSQHTRSNIRDVITLIAGSNHQSVS
jgi:hypothetical protein